MKQVLQILSIVALVGSAGLFTSGCADEFDDFEDMDELRPERPACSNCSGTLSTSGTDSHTNLGISTTYSPALITNVSIQLSNAAGTELIDYGNSLSIPNDPNFITVPDNELCTVGTTGSPPTVMYVEFEITDAAGSYTVGNNIPFTGTCS